MDRKESESEVSGGVGSPEDKGFSVDMRSMEMNRAASITQEEEQITFAWEGLTVITGAGEMKSDCCKKKGSQAASKVLVDHNTGYVKPGDLVAIMGASGAGKSTLLNAMTFRTSSDLLVTGTRYVNGKAISPDALTAVSAYILQDDLFIGTLTPREHLEFMAKVRMDDSVSKKRRKERVEYIIRELGLAKCQNTLIGIPGRVKGISGGESKRLAFATEVLTNPPLLFCDEPTSGLDSYMAQNVVEVLSALTKQGKSIICTIHQPSSEVFGIFTKVLLMAEGKLAYLGGRERCDSFFAECGFPCPEKFNPADHYVRVLAIMPKHEDQCRERVKAITQKFAESPEGQHINSVVEYEKTHMKKHPDIEKFQNKKSPYRATWWTQFLALLWRSWTAVIKEPQVVQVLLGQTIATGLLIGIVFLQQEYDQEGVINIQGAIFITLTSVTFSNQFSVINVFCLELPVFLREHFNGAYRVEPYYIAKQLAEIPFYLIMPVLFSTIIYWMVGLNSDFERYIIFVLIIVLLTQAVTSWGYFISCAVGDIQIALAVAPALMIPILLFGGFFLNSDTVPDWLIWIQYISWFHYSNEALTINQWKDYSGGIECPPDYVAVELNCTQFPVAPECQAGAGAFNISVLAPCQFDEGQDVIDFYAMNEDNLILDILMIVVIMLVLRVGGFVALFLRSYRKH